MLLTKRSDALSIGEDVWIAAGCKILRGTVLENAYVVGVDTVVNGRIESGDNVAGVPAKTLCTKNQGQVNVK